MYMTSQKQGVSSKQEMLNALAENTLVPKDFAKVDYKVGNDKFTSYVGTQPIKYSGSLSLKGYDYVNKDGVVVGLNLQEQLYLSRKLSSRIGNEIRFGTLREQLAAAWSKDSSKYLNNVLKPYWVFTGQILRDAGANYEVRKAEKAEFVKQQSKPIDAELLVELDGKILNKETESEKIVPKLSLGPLIQKYPINTIVSNGYYSDFQGELPTNKELENNKTKKSLGYFGGIYPNNESLFAVWSDWYSDIGVLFAYADRPLFRGSSGVLGAWTDENPKKSPQKPWKS